MVRQEGENVIRHINDARLLEKVFDISCIA